MLARLMRTAPDPASAILRVVLGVVMLPHGPQHLLGWFGGPGLSGTLQYFREILGLPAATVVLVIAVELVGGAALVVGLLGRVAALGVAALMVGAALTVHVPHGFFMNWFGTQAGEGWEYHLLALAMSAVVVLKGSGAWSLDGWLVPYLEPRAPTRAPRVAPNRGNAHTEEAS